MAKKVRNPHATPDPDIVASAVQAAARCVGVVHITSTDSPTLDHTGVIIARIAKAIVAELGKDD